MGFEPVVQELLRKYALQNAVLHGGQAQPKAVLGKVLAERPELRPRARELQLLADAVVAEVNGLAAEEQRKQLEALAPELLERAKPAEAPGLPELPRVEGAVVMRLAPYPSGPLHIGNARAVLLNDEYVRRYKGKLLLVHDDTIGSEEKVPLVEAYGWVEEGLRWLGVGWQERLYKSDRLPLFYEWGERLLRLGGAYVCLCGAQELRERRERGEACAHRGRSAEENLGDWKRMLDGGYREGEAVVRLKTDMKHPNPAFRDRVLFRISEREHPRVGRRYRVWPLLEFSWAVDDHLLGCTHVLRGKDLVMEDLMEEALWDYFDIRGRPEFLHYGILRLREAELSKSAMARLVREGKLMGIDDPRTWSLESLRRRGIQPEAVRKFIVAMGMSLSDIEVPAEVLYSENRRIVDLGANRYFFVPNPVEIRVKNPPEVRQAKVPVHPDDPARGHRILAVRPRLFVPGPDFLEFEGQEVRLKDLFNIHLGREATFTGRGVKELPKIQWLAEGLPTRVVMPDATVVEGLGEPGLARAKAGDVVQFERFGFVRLDAVGEHIVAWFAHR